MIDPNTPKRGETYDLPSGARFIIDRELQSGGFSCIYISAEDGAKLQRGWMRSGITLTELFVMCHCKLVLAVAA